MPRLSVISIKAVKKLDQEIPLITEYIGYVREYANDIHNAYTENGGSNAGQYVTRFDEKENDNHSKVTTIIQNMEWALTDPQDKRTYASTQYSYWQEVCEQEDAREAMTAFMDLMLQYHASFIGSPNDPVQEAVDGINACVDALGNFYTDSDAYLELEKKSRKACRRSRYWTRIRN